MKAKKMIEVTETEAAYLCRALETALQCNMYNPPLGGSDPAATIAAWKRERPKFVRRRTMDRVHRETRPEAIESRGAMDQDAAMLARIFPLVAA